MNSFEEVLAVVNSNYNKIIDTDMSVLSPKDHAPVNPYGQIFYGSMLQLENEVFSDFVCEYVLDKEPNSDDAKKMFEDLESGVTNKDKIIYDIAMDEAFIRGPKDILGLGIETIPMNDLLRFPDEDEVFLRHVYIWVFGRVPDEAGFNIFLNMLKNGMSHLNLLYALSKSEEAENRDIKIPGLKKAYYIAKIRNILGRIKGKLVKIAGGKKGE